MVMVIMIVLLRVMGGGDGEPGSFVDRDGGSDSDSDGVVDGDHNGPGQSHGEYDLIVTLLMPREKEALLGVKQNLVSR